MTSKSRASWDQKPAGTRRTRSSATQDGPTKPLQPQASGPSAPRAASGLAQGLSLMTVTGQARRASRGRRGPGAGGQSSGPGAGGQSSGPGAGGQSSGPGAGGQSSGPGAGGQSSGPGAGGQSSGPGAGGQSSGPGGGGQSSGPGAGGQSLGPGAGGQSSGPGAGGQSSGPGGQSSGPGAGGQSSGPPRGGLGAVARLLKQGRCRNVVVVAGAGISTASGIPDFRTPGTGLYANLQKYNIPYPEAIFNIDCFSADPRPFFSLAKELYPGERRPNFIHYFLRMLHHKGLLLRLYTQNIDGLERMCGIPDDKLVEGHGSFATASCHLCYTPYPAEEAKSSIMSDGVPVCGFCAATVKPDIVFFGEDLPEKYFQHATDFPQADLLIVMGTSLQIEPFASLVNTVRPGVPRLLLNRDAVGPFGTTPRRQGDHVQLGDLLENVQRLAEMLGWHADIQDLMSSLEHGETVSTTLVSSGQELSQTRPTGLGRRGAPRPPAWRPPKYRPGAPGPGSRSDAEESDSDTDSKSTVSSSPSN